MWWAAGWGIRGGDLSWMLCTHKIVSAVRGGRLFQAAFFLHGLRLLCGLDLSALLCQHCGEFGKSSYNLLRNA